MADDDTVTPDEASGAQPPLSTQPPPARDPPPPEPPPERPQFQSHTGQILAGQAALGEREQDIYTRRARELDPLIGSAERSMAQRRPAVPRQERQQPFKSPGTDAMWGWANAAAVMGALAGAFGRRSATSALNAMAGMNKGLAEGNIEAYNRSYKEWEANAKTTRENNEAKLQEYRTVLESQKYDIEQKMSMIELVANKYRDELAGQAAQQKNFTALAEIVQKGDESQNKFTTEMEKVQEHNQNLHARLMSRGGPEWFEWYQSLSPEEQQEYKNAYQSGAKGNQAAVTEQRKEQAKDIVSEIKAGRQPPTLTGMYGMTPFVRDEAATQKVDLTKMQVDWARAQAQIRTLNSAQISRLASAANSIIPAIGHAKELAARMDLSGMTGLNQVELYRLVHTKGNTPEGQLATEYITTINGIKEQFANAITGGYAPTEAAWDLANSQINANYGVNQLGASLDEVERLLNYRIQAIPNYSTLGPAAANPYVPGSGQPPAAAPAAAPPPSGRVIKYDAQGNRL